MVVCCRYYIDYEDIVDDIFFEVGCCFEINEMGLVNGSFNGIFINQDFDLYDFEDKEKKEVEEVFSGFF